MSKWSYYETRFYRGKGGAFIEVEPVLGIRPKRWRFRFVPSKLWFDGYPRKEKFGALLAAAHHAGYSMKDMNWEPTQ